MLSPVLFILWIPVIGVASILLAAVLVLGAAVGLDEAVRGRPAVPPRAEGPAPAALPGLPRKAA